MTRWCCGVLLAAVIAGPIAAADDVRLAPDCLIGFAASDEGRQIVTADDAFTASLSPFDLQCRMKSDKEVTLAQWKQFVAQRVRPWEKADAETVTQSLERLSKRLASFRLPLPPMIRLVRTTGEEESNAAYTRGTAIVLPSKVMSYEATQLDRLLTHELFHLLSRQDGAIRARLYGIIGFELCEPIELPRSLAPRRITNPDAPLTDCTIALKRADGKTFVGAPVLYSSTKEYDAKRGASLFQSLVFRLLVVERRGGHYDPVSARGEPVVIDPHKEPEFLDKVGKNTNYLIHPDEILADNFVRLVMEDKDVPTPRIIEEMRRVLGRQ